MCGPRVDSVPTRSGDHGLGFTHSLHITVLYVLCLTLTDHKTQPFSTSHHLQTHDKLLQTRHPKRDIISTRAREYVHVNGKRKLAIMICHRCTTFNTRNVSLNM
jgi:hypothetical protein